MSNILFVVAFLLVVYMVYASKNNFVGLNKHPHLILTIGSLLGGVMLILGIISYSKISTQLGELLKIHKKQKEGMEYFKTSEELYSRMIEITEEADLVYTHKLTAPPNKLGAKTEEYFNLTTKNIKENKIKIFTRMVSIHDRIKAIWVLELLNELHGFDNFTLSRIINTTADSPLGYQFHLVEKGDEKFLLQVYEIDYRGNAPSILIKHKEIANLAKSTYEKNYAKSIKLKEGRHFEWEAITDIATQFELLDDKNYLELLSKKLT